MNYTKPEVAVLGDAARLIESIHSVKFGGQSNDGLSRQAVTPAYDLDE
jgi:hypothetical protein